MASKELRKGMWVVLDDDRVGILVSFLDFGTSEVHLVNGEGETILVVQKPTSELRQAAFTDIPESRRPALNVARQLGY